MSSFLDSILCCCLRRKSIDEDADERDQLLPPVEDGPSVMTYDATTIDHQKAKERLHVIVKAKEGKMVRVLSRVPFNLRNDPENGLPNTASSSRSNRSPSTNLSYTHHTRAGDQFGRNSNGRRSSSKPAPSPSISRSESASSIQQASLSRVSTDDFTDPYTEHKLKVQLIPTMKSKQRLYSRRGRSKTKQGRFTDEADGTDNVPTLEGIQSVDSGRGNFDAPGEQYPIKSTEELGASSGSNNVDLRQTTPLSDEENSEIKGISRELSPKLIKDEFEDVGMLTRSWGD